MGYDDNAAENSLNYKLLFSWISQSADIEVDEDGNERTSIKDSIISQCRQIKKLAEFVNDAQAVKRMEESRSIAEGYSYSDVIGENRLGQ